MARLAAIIAHATAFAALAGRQHTSEHVAALDAQATYDTIFAAMKNIFLNKADPMPTTVDHHTWAADATFTPLLVAAAATGVTNNAGPSAVNITAEMKKGATNGMNGLGQCLMMQSSAITDVRSKQADKLTKNEIWEATPAEQTWDVFAGVNLPHLQGFSCTIGTGNACLTEIDSFKTDVQAVLGGMQAKFDKAREPKVALEAAVVAENAVLTTMKTTCKGALDALHADLCPAGGLVGLLRQQRDADAMQAAAEATEKVINALVADPSKDFTVAMHTEASVEKAERLNEAWEYEAGYKFGSGCDLLFHTATDKTNHDMKMGDLATGMPPCEFDREFRFEELDAFCAAHR